MQPAEDSISSLIPSGNLEERDGASVPQSSAVAVKSVLDDVHIICVSIRMALQFNNDSNTFGENMAKLQPKSLNLALAFIRVGFI